MNTTDLELEMLKEVDFFHYKTVLFCIKHFTLLNYL